MEGCFELPYDQYGGPVMILGFFAFIESNEGVLVIGDAIRKDQFLFRFFTIFRLPLNWPSWQVIDGVHVKTDLQPRQGLLQKLFWATGDP
jgi:hypothetical protein